MALTMRPGWAMTPREMKARTKRFAVEVIKLCRDLPATIEGRVIAGQLVRAGTSVAANYRSACRGRSRAEFIAKLGVVLEESDESLLWLEVIVDANVLPQSRVDRVLREADELTAIFTTAIKTARGNSA
ncbi:MAG TPA: four helix bundle protein [Vicinamibacterales bacterium]|jgi:four helix bundle protein